MEEIICTILSSPWAAFLAECNISKCDESIDSCRNDICKKKKKKLILIYEHYDHYIAPSESSPRPKLTFDHDNCSFPEWRSEVWSLGSSSASSTEGFIFICLLKIKDGRLRGRVVVVVGLRSFLWGMIDRLEHHAKPGPLPRSNAGTGTVCIRSTANNSCESWVKQNI